MQLVHEGDSDVSVSGVPGQQKGGRWYCALLQSKLELLGLVCPSGVARQRVLRDADTLGLWHMSSHRTTPPEGYSDSWHVLCLLFLSASPPLPSSHSRSSQPRSLPISTDCGTAIRSVSRERSISSETCRRLSASNTTTPSPPTPPAARNRAAPSPGFTAASQQTGNCFCQILQAVPGNGRQRFSGARVYTVQCAVQCQCVPNRAFSCFTLPGSGRRHQPGSTLS